MSKRGKITANAEETGGSASKECEGIQMEDLWKEMKSWRKHWKLNRFFHVLILCLVASIVDSATDFNFAWSVPEDCPHLHVYKNTTENSMEHFDISYVSSPCGIFASENVERLTYTYIAYPGFLLGFSALHNLVRGLFIRCCGGGGKVNGIVSLLVTAFAVALEVSIFLGLLMASQWSDLWTHDRPALAKVYDFTIHGMAYLSAGLIAGIHCIGTFCHGPESCRLVFRAKEAETKFEATLQLSVLTRISLSSGLTTPAGILSAISSISVICKNGVQNFLNRHEAKLEEASILGKICVASSVLPVFLLASVFKLGSIANNLLWNKTVGVLLLFLGIGLPNLVLLPFKMCNRLQDLTVAFINQSVISDILTLHLWPKSRNGKRIGLAMTIFIFLFYASTGPLIISNPEPKTSWGEKGTNDKEYMEWASKTGERVQVASVILLMIAPIYLVLVICITLLEDQWVAKIVSKFPKHSREAVWFNDESPRAEFEIDH